MFALMARPEDAALSADAALNARGQHRAVNSTVWFESVCHCLPRLLLGFPWTRVHYLLVVRLRSPSAFSACGPYAARHS